MHVFMLVHVCIYLHMCAYIHTYVHVYSMYVLLVCLTELTVCCK